MQIHELNNFTGTLGAGAYLAVDDGNDTGKLSTQQLLAATEARIDNIIAGPAPSAEEIVDARYGADGVTYPSLGDAIRDQVTDLKSDLSEANHKMQYGEIEVTFGDWKMGGFHTGGLESSTKIAYAKLDALQGDVIKTSADDSAWYGNIVTTTDNVNVADILKGSYATFSAFGNDEYVVPRDCTVYVNVRNAAKSADASIISASSVNVTVIKKSTSLIQTNKEAIDAIKTGWSIMTNPYDLPLRYGNFSTSGNYTYHLSALSTEHWIKVKKGSTISATDSTIQFQVIEVNEATYAVYNYQTWTSNAYVVANDCMLGIGIRLTSQAVLSDNSLLSKLNINLKTNTPTQRNDKRKQIVSGTIPTNWYVGKHADETGMNQDTDYDTAIALWRQLAVDYNGYITESDMGATYNSKHIYAYTLEPPHDTPPQTDWASRNIPTVIITSGMHGHEKSGTYGLYYLIKDMMEHSLEDPVLMYLRNNVRLIIMPAINVYGWNENSRYNQNGVNLNRNFGCYNWSDFDSDPTYTTPWEYNYRGTAPFSELETQAVRTAITYNSYNYKTCLVIDYHTYGINTSAYDEIAWATCPYVSWNDYTRKMNDIPVPFIAKLRSVLDEEYDVNAPLNVVYGEATQEQERPSLPTWVWESANMLATTLECTSGADSFLGSKLTRYSPDVIKFNAELIANYIMSILKEMTE